MASLALVSVERPLISDPPRALSCFFHLCAVYGRWSWQVSCARQTKPLLGLSWRLSHILTPHLDCHGLPLGQIRDLLVIVAGFCQSAVASLVNMYLLPGLRGRLYFFPAPHLMS